MEKLKTKKGEGEKLVVTDPINNSKLAFDQSKCVYYLTERESALNTFFCIDFQESNEATQYLFDDLPYSLFTTFMLILGEMKYPHTVFKYQPLPYPGISYVVYVIFCVCMPIIIKNLLVSTKALRRVLLFKR